MNYRHTFHAGNFADVFKHIVLIALTKSFLRKDTAFCYLDTHAGIGQYDLLADTTQKSKEYEDGVGKVFKTENTPELIREYLACIENINSDNTLRFYPGSPKFARYFLREQDRMMLCELHPEDYQTLKKYFARDKQTAVHHQDAYQSLKALLPPKEKRGLILIDPPYENSFEFSAITSALEQALKRFENGVYAVWYPIKDKAPVEKFYRALKEKISRPILACEMSIYPDDVAIQLNGCGMIIINPPFQIDEQLKEALPWLWETLAVHKQSGYSIKFL